MVTYDSLCDDISLFRVGKSTRKGARVSFRLTIDIKFLYIYFMMKIVSDARHSRIFVSFFHNSQTSVITKPPYYTRGWHSALFCHSYFRQVRETDILTTVSIDTSCIEHALLLIKANINTCNLNFILLQPFKYEKGYNTIKTKVPCIIKVLSRCGRGNTMIWRLIIQILVFKEIRSIL